MIKRQGRLLGLAFCLLVAAAGWNAAPADEAEAQAILVSAQAALKNREYENAETLAQKAIKSHDKCYQALLLLADVADAKRDKMLRGEYLLRAYEILEGIAKPTDAQKADRVAVEELLEKHYRGDWTDYQKNRAKFVDEMVALAKTEMDAGNAGNAVLAIEEAIKIDPTNETLLALLNQYKGVADTGAALLYNGINLQGWTVESGEWKPGKEGIDVAEAEGAQPPYTLKLDAPACAGFDITCNVLLRSGFRWGSEAALVVRSANPEFDACEFVIGTKNVTLITTPKQESEGQQVLPVTRGMKLLDEASDYDKSQTFKLACSQRSLTLSMNGTVLLEYVFEEGAAPGDMSVALRLTKGGCQFMPVSFSESGK